MGSYTPLLAALTLLVIVGAVLKPLFKKAPNVYTERDVQTALAASILLGLFGWGMGASSLGEVLILPGMGLTVVGGMALTRTVSLWNTQQVGRRQAEQIPGGYKFDVTEWEQRLREPFADK